MIDIKTAMGEINRKQEEQQAFFNQFKHARDIFEIEYNCECADKYTALEALVADIPEGTYQDIDIRIMYEKFLAKGFCIVRNHLKDLHGTFVWDKQGVINKRESSRWEY